MPVLTYGVETEATTKKQVNDMQKTQREMERIILGIRRSGRVRNEETRKISKVVDIGYKLFSSFFPLYKIHYKI